MDGAFSATAAVLCSRQNPPSQSAAKRIHIPKPYGGPWEAWVPPVAFGFARGLHPGA